MHILSTQDRNVIQEGLDIVFGHPNNDQPPDERTDREASWQTPDVVICKLTAKLNGRGGVSPGVLNNVQVYKMGTGGLVAATGFTIKLHNRYKCPVFHLAQEYVIAQRDKFGTWWLAERPISRHKGVVNDVAGIPIDDFGTVDLWFNGAISSPLESVGAWLDWMHGNQPISNNKEVVVQFYEDQGKWVAENAECETA